MIIFFTVYVCVYKNEALVVSPKISDTSHFANNGAIEPSSKICPLPEKICARFEMQLKLAGIAWFPWDLVVLITTMCLSINR